MEKKNPIQIKREIKRTISNKEIYASFVIIILLFSIILWVMFQRDAYNPEDRDISPDMLKSSSGTIPLYKAPLKKLSIPESGKTPKQLSTGIIPVSIIRGGWTLNAPIRYYNPKNLYVKINGEAIKFLKEGFRTLHYLILKNSSGNEEITIELYDQGDEKGSIGVFSEYSSGTRNLRRKGNSIFLMTSAGAIGRKGPFFFRISGNVVSKTVRAKSMQIASALSALPGRKKAEAPGFRILNRGMKINAGSIEYKGKNVFQFGYANDFWFGRPDKNSEGRLFLHVSGSSSVAANLFKKIVDDQAMDYKVIKKDTVYTLMQHSYLKTFFAIRVKGNYIYGIEKIRDRETIPGLLGKLEKELN